MNLLAEIVEIPMHPVIHWFDMISGVIVGLLVLWMLIELILMIPDFIRTIKIHMM